MSKAIYTGVGNTARKVPKLYVGVNGVARKVKKGYVGVGGVARLFYETAPDFKIKNINQKTFSTALPYDDLLYANGKFYTVGKPNDYSLDIYNSTDGISWNSSPILKTESGSPIYPFRMAYGNGIFVVPFRHYTSTTVNGSGTFTSSDGVNWTRNDLDLSATISRQKMLFAKGKFVCVVYTTTGNFTVRIQISTDGVTWSSTDVLSTESRALNMKNFDLTYADNQFILSFTLSSSSGTSYYLHNYVYTSPDASTWTQVLYKGQTYHTSAFNLIPDTVQKLPNNGKIISAHHKNIGGVNFTPTGFTLDYILDGSFETVLSDINFVNGQLLKNQVLAYFVNNSSTLYISNDGTDWSTIDMGYSLVGDTAVAHSDSRCVVITNEGKNVIYFDYE